MKTLTLCAGLLFAVAANAALTTRATLIGARVNRSFAGSPLLICKYSGAHANFEILAQSGTCAPYIDVQ
jgi:hypothetical protein